MRRKQTHQWKHKITGEKKIWIPLESIDEYETIEMPHEDDSRLRDRT
tara:strand:- start:4851 stop:4991 length:141 start_codon:yes stop_codon:yes gene_type:complete